eukprot:jgi/Tetstr1/448158/TSEL_035450.t1
MVRGSSGKTPKSSVYRGVTLFRPTGKWRAQISAYGKTTSLGDHETEEEAARAFDRAVINKDFWAARTNFPIEEYSDEIAYIHGLPHADLVALLRDAARKNGSTSSYKGVSLLKPTGKWNAQINLSGKQVHLGLHSIEEDAARAYDRAAIFKALQNGTSAETNFEIENYDSEINHLARLTEEELVAEAISSCTSPTAGNDPSKDKAAATRADSKARKASRPPSPSTPQHSEEGGFRPVYRHQFIQRNCYSVNSGAIGKRTLNRRCRQIPIRACLA